MEAAPTRPQLPGGRRNSFFFVVDFLSAPPPPPSFFSKKRDSNYSSLYVNCAFFVLFQNQAGGGIWMHLIEDGWLRMWTKQKSPPRGPHSRIRWRGSAPLKFVWKTKKRIFSIKILAWVIFRKNIRWYENRRIKSVGGIEMLVRHCWNRFETWDCGTKNEKNSN